MKSGCRKNEEINLTDVLSRFSMREQSDKTTWNFKRENCVGQIPDMIRNLFSHDVEMLAQYLETGEDSIGHGVMKTWAVVSLIRPLLTE